MQLNPQNLNFEIRPVKSEETDPSIMLIRINEDCFEKFAVRNLNFNIRHHCSWDVMDTIPTFYNMFERFLPSAKSNLHVLRQKMRDFYNNVMKKKSIERKMCRCVERCEAWAFVLLSLSSTFSQHNLHIKSETFF